MNVDFEMELATGDKPYRVPGLLESINQHLTKRLMWLAKRGDAILFHRLPERNISETARMRGLAIKTLETPFRKDEYVFSPWGWSKRIVEIGLRSNAIMEFPSLEIVRRVNSKLWSHSIERDLGCDLKGSAVAESIDELYEIVAKACPFPNDKWVIKSSFGFAARGRVLGRGPLVQYAQATWAKREFNRSGPLLFQPWVDVTREYGVVMMVDKEGGHQFLGVSDLQTNGAGTGIGYLLGRQISPMRRLQLERFAEIVCARLVAEGYYGPAGFDALEHSGGLLPILEINARYTMGFVAVEVERHLCPISPIFWDTRITRKNQIPRTK